MAQLSVRETQAFAWLYLKDLYDFNQSLHSCSIRNSLPVSLAEYNEPVLCPQRYWSGERTRFRQEKDTKEGGSVTLFLS